MACRPAGGPMCICLEHLAGFLIYTQNLKIRFRLVFPFRIHLNICVTDTHSVRIYGMAFNSAVNLARIRRCHNVIPYLQIFRHSVWKLNIIII
jgi:hypothetical protein